ncbi:hypothetical protein NUW54_g9927 [Trametes sanguinea]|uniref:Uncharacterized protein n=1 Tax=Trametes sanguinea TaxID=158606 RepID=A0ACC1P497_9APHY|nr:hypothetical protein NUW54_g9927 [Trametes sanguinea]
MTRAYSTSECKLRSDACGRTIWIDLGIRKEIEGFVQAIDGADDGVDDPRGTLVDVAFIEAALNSDGAPVDLVELAKV